MDSVTFGRGAATRRRRRACRRRAKIRLVLGLVVLGHLADVVGLVEAARGAWAADEPVCACSEARARQPICSMRDTVKRTHGQGRVGAH